MIQCVLDCQTTSYFHLFERKWLFAWTNRDLTKMGGYKPKRFFVEMHEHGRFDCTVGFVLGQRQYFVWVARTYFDWCK